MSSLVLIAFYAALLGPVDKPNPTPFEKVPPEEAAQIETITKLTVDQLKQRYPGTRPVLRDVHPKDHGCVQATFEVDPALPEALRIGVFAKPGRKYPAWIRYSNAAVLVAPDSSSSPTPHGSRGMAVKLMGVEGTTLLGDGGPITQDFLMVNQPVFAFANVDDYGALSRVLLEDKDNPIRFFAERVKIKDGKPDLTDPATVRALNTRRISGRIQATKVDGDQGAFQEPPVSPVDNRYFSAAPYLYGANKVMKYSARPVERKTGVAPDVSDPNYLRKALVERLSGSGAKDVVFQFQVQIRTMADLAGKLDTEIEDACTLWDEKTYPPVTVATITIPPQDFDTDARRRKCEALSFTPWHGLAEHQPIGGINRLKLGVYRASSEYRHLPKEPTSFDD